MLGEKLVGQDALVRLGGISAVLLHWGNGKRELSLVDFGRVLKRLCDARQV
jgi:hypothetical protein